MTLKTQLSELPNPQRRALELVGDVASEKGLRPYLVGGPVRDILLGRHAIDVDVTLEEGGSTLARAVAKRVEGRVRSFPQFLTYKVSADGLPEIDITTARKERYRKPGALPTVSEGKLKDDLMRRDFSINAVAYDILRDELHDPTHGAEDLEARLIRVLHDKSFTDDPTRIYRALRLAARLGFEIEEDTAELMSDAIAGDALQTVSRERLWRELFLAMEEKDAPRVLRALNDAGALEVLFGRRAEDLNGTLEAVQRTVDGEPELDREVLYTAALLRGDASPIDFEGSGFSQKRARNVVQIANELPRIAEALGSAHSDADRFRLLERVSPEMLKVLAAEHPGEATHIDRFREFRNFKLPLRGNDLDVPGGPHIARALERTREAVFSGEVPAEEARRFARELAMQYLSAEE